VSASGVTVANTGTIIALSNVLEGTGLKNRVGTRIGAIRLDFNYEIFYGSGPATVRIIIFRDK